MLAAVCSFDEDVKQLCLLSSNHTQVTHSTNTNQMKSNSTTMYSVPEKPTVLAGHLKYTDTMLFK